MANKLSDSFDKDKDGVKYKYPPRELAKTVLDIPVSEVLSAVFVISPSMVVCIIKTVGLINDKMSWWARNDDSIYHTR